MPPPSGTSKSSLQPRLVSPPSFLLQSPMMLAAPMACVAGPSSAFMGSTAGFRAAPARPASAPVRLTVEAAASRVKKSETLERLKLKFDPETALFVAGVNYKGMSVRRRRRLSSWRQDGEKESMSGYRHIVSVASFTAPAAGRALSYMPGLRPCLL